MTATSSRATRAALQRVVYIEPQREERRRQAERDGGNKRGDKRPAENMPVKGEHDAFAVLTYGSNGEPIGGPLCDKDRAGATGNSQQQRLRDQRTQQLRARGAQGGTDGEFPSARHRPGKEKVREI